MSNSSIRPRQSCHLWMTSSCGTGQRPLIHTHIRLGGLIQLARRPKHRASVLRQITCGPHELLWGSRILGGRYVATL